MARTSYPPAVKAAAAAKYIPQLVDPLVPVAEHVGKLLAAEVKGIVEARGGGVIPASSIQERIVTVVREALGRSLEAQSPEGKKLRMRLIAALADAEAGEALVPRGQAASEDSLLTTAEAAARLEVSRPYISMLCDHGKLGEVSTTEGGHRRIRSSAVEAYRAARTKLTQGAKSPRQAASDAGLYEYPDGHFTNVVRASAKKPKSSKTSAKAARKPRS